jgi:capsular polysaccharide biosynthesis protein
LIVYAAGIAAGLVLFVLPVLAKAFLLPVVRSEEVVGGWADVPVLVSIPRIPTPQTMSSERLSRMTNIVGAAVACIVLAITMKFLH